jgi:hypothetical protein
VYALFRTRVCLFARTVPVYRYTLQPWQANGFNKNNNTLSSTSTCTQPKNCAHTYVRAVSLKLCSVLGSRITLETKIRYLYCFQLVLSISTCDPNARSRLTPRSSSSSPPSPSFATRTASQQGLTCSPRHPPHIERMLATSPTMKCTGARHITHRELTGARPSSTAKCTGAPHVVRITRQSKVKHQGQSLNECLKPLELLQLHESQQSDCKWPVPE